MPKCGGIGTFRTYEFIPLEEEYDFDLENYPDIDKEILLKYLKASLYNIRTKQKSEKVLKKELKD